MIQLRGSSIDEEVKNPNKNVTYKVSNFRVKGKTFLKIKV